MPSVLVTRRLPARVTAPLEEIASVEAGPREGWPREELLARAAGADAIVSQLTDRIDGELIEAAPSLRIIANGAVGYPRAKGTGARLGRALVLLAGSESVGGASRGSRAAIRHKGPLTAWGRPQNAPMQRVRRATAVAARNESARCEC